MNSSAHVVQVEGASSPSHTGTPPAPLLALDSRVPSVADGSRLWEIAKDSQVLSTNPRSACARRRCLPACHRARPAIRQTRRDHRRLTHRTSQVVHA
ncbi:hypothetical protein EF294_16035 [Gordonia oryzae]|uniref:Uncharacterized protein n=1 Tax=Gordonia oryzae TaxID=2487349 RepID=A0A3N4GCH0_9ACTN|nr:hypothetical protein EF294_16035 [Gordonia oryzae]